MMTPLNPSAHHERVPRIQVPIKAFCIDFNWDCTYRAASPGLYAQADPSEHVRWYQDLGANVIQSFLVSYNGFAWYPSEVAPVTPGLKGDFIGELTRLAHAAGLRCFGYFCLGANLWWEMHHQELVHWDCRKWNIPYTDAYLDYFCASVTEAFRRVPVDGALIDWIRPPLRKRWLDCEKELFRHFLGESFPSTGTVPEIVEIEFQRRVLEHAWRRIRAAANDARPGVILWTNHPFQLTAQGLSSSAHKVTGKAQFSPLGERTLWEGHHILQDADWVLNECPDPALLAWLDHHTGDHTVVIQNICGWQSHDAGIWRGIDPRRHGLYGFACADPETTLLERQPRFHPANMRNLEIVRQAYHTLQPTNTGASAPTA